MTKEERLQKQRLRLAEMKEPEAALHRRGYRCIAGVDEAGRGPLAGPVVAAAVVLPEDFDVLGIDDSKKLSEKRREELFEVIREKALAWGVGMADHLEIDEINILQATKLAMKRALKALEQQLAAQEEGFRENNGREANACREAPAEDTPKGDEALYHEQKAKALDYILLDAVKLEDVNLPQEAIIKGDAKALAIAAASILAKVTRDRMMLDYAEQYPGYAFEKNKGYGTKAHYEGLREHGICPIHRKTFLKNL